MKKQIEKKDQTRRTRAAFVRERLAREASKLDPKEEQAMADEGLARDLEEWPKY